MTELKVSICPIVYGKLSNALEQVQLIPVTIPNKPITESKLSKLIRWFKKY